MNIMKKILLFALAAMTLAFVACDKKDKKKSEPEPEGKVLNATGELRGVMFDVYNENQQAVVTYYADKNTIDVKFVKAEGYLYL